MRIVYTTAAAMLVFTTIASANEADIARRLQKLEEALARIEARVAKLESSPREDRRGMMGGGMMGGGMMGGGMMGEGRPNEQWRKPEAKK